MRRPTTIRSHLIILVVVATLPLAGLWAYIVFAQFKFRQETAWSMTHQVAQLTAASVRQFFEETRLMLESMASSARDRMFDRSDCTAFLVDASLTAPMYVGFSIVDSEGTVLCTSIPTDVRSIRDREWFELVSRRGTFSVGKPVIGLVSRDWVSVMALPIENSDGGRL